jgi:hypothetical protein
MLPRARQGALALSPCGGFVMACDNHLDTDSR